MNCSSKQSRRSVSLLSLGALLALLYAGPAAAARSVCSVQNPATLVELDSEALPLKAVELLQKIPGPGGRKVSRAILAASLVDNRLIARHALAELGEAELYKAPEVGFDRRFLLEQRVAGIFRTLFEPDMESFIRKQSGGSLSSMVTEQIQSRLPEIKTALTPRQQFRDDLDAEQRKLAQSIEVARYQFPNRATRSFTLWDLYSTQNVQNRMRLHQLDLSALAQALDERVAAAFVRDWVETHSGLSAEEILWIERYVTDGQAKIVYLNSIGLARDLHSDNQALSQVRELLTPAEIRAYYDANREQFRRIESVKARHIRLADEAAAERAYQAIQSGMNFDDTVRRFSIAEDRTASPPGDLGRINLTGAKGWLESVTAALKPGRVSRPIRAPAEPGQDAYWEIFYVDEQQTGYYEPDSETVRYLAGRALGSQKLVGRYKQVREKLYQDARICINPAHLSYDKAGLMKTAARESVSGGL